MLSKLYRAMMERDQKQLATLLSEAARDDVWFNPLEVESFQTRDGGSLIGLCVSYQWHDGVRVCRDAGLNPDRNAMVRDPLMWAYHNDDVVSLELLLEMGPDPARLSPDTRFWGVSRTEDELTADRLTELAPTLGDLDVFYLKSLLAEERPVELRPVFGRMALNDLRPNSHAFFERLAPLVVKSESCRWFAQFAYFRAWSLGHKDVALELLDALSLQPDLSIVEDRMGLVDPMERFGVNMENPDRSAPWVMAAIKGGRSAFQH